MSYAYIGVLNKINNLSFIVPCENDRFPLFKITYDEYVKFGFDNIDVEFVLVSRTIKNCSLPNVKIINYEYKGEFFNPAMALNLGVKTSKFNNLIITSPEIKPLTNVVKQLSLLQRGNYICQVFDQNENKTVGESLVNTHYRGHIPSMYFLALFKKEDIEQINGWDESFMGGFAWEDIDFGERFMRAGLQFKVLNYIQGLHQWHPRSYHNQGWGINRKMLERNINDNIIKARKGLV